MITTKFTDEGLKSFCDIINKDKSKARIKLGSIEADLIEAKVEGDKIVGYYMNGITAILVTRDN